MDARQLKEKALQHFQKGRFAKSAEVWAEACRVDPKDIQSRLRLGDALAKAGDDSAAADAYRAAAEGFAKQGFIPRAIAAAKLALALRPADESVQGLLTSFYAERGVSAPVASTPSQLGTSSPSLPSSTALAPTPVMAPAPVRPPSSPRLAPTPGPPPVLAPSTRPAAPPRAPPVLEAVADPELTPPSRVPLPVVTPPSPTGKWNELPSSLASALDEAAGGFRPGDETKPPQSRGSARAEPPPPDIEAAEDEAGAPGSEAEQPGAPGDDGEAEAPGAGDDDGLDHTPAPASRRPDEEEEPSTLQTLNAGQAEELKRRLAQLNPTDSTLPGRNAAAAQVLKETSSNPDRTQFAQSPFLPEGDTGEADVPQGLGKGDASGQGPLPRIPLFAELSQEAFLALFDSCPLHRLQKGDVVLEQDARGDSFYVICAGRVRVYREEPQGRRELALLEEGAFFGELALLTGAPRSAWVVAEVDDTQLLEVSGAAVRQLASQHPSVAQGLASLARKRLLSNVMAADALFAGLKRSERLELAERFEARDLPGGELVLDWRDEPLCLLVVVSGELLLDDGEGNATTVGPGHLVGDLALLSGSVSCTVETVKRTLLLSLPAEYARWLLSHASVQARREELLEARAPRGGV